MEILREAFPCWELLEPSLGLFVQSAVVEIDAMGGSTPVL